MSIYSILCNKNGECSDDVYVTRFCGLPAIEASMLSIN